MRQIDADKVKIEIEKQIAYCDEKSKNQSNMKEVLRYANTSYGLRLANNYIDNAPTVKTYCYYCGQTEHGKIEEMKEDRWISVSKKLPPNHILCLFCDIDGDIYYGHHNSENNRWYAEYLDDKIPNVVAWQELPEPYKKETTFDYYLAEQMKDPEFRKEWEKLSDEDKKGGAEC